MDKKKFPATGHNQKSKPALNQSLSEPEVHAGARNHMRDLLIAGTATGIGLSAALCSVSCDPIPAPFYWTCSDSANDLWNTGLSPNAILHFDNGKWTIQVTMQLNDPSYPKELSFAGAPILSGGKLLYANVNTTDISFVCTPDSAVTIITIGQPMQCPNKLFSVHYDLLISYPLVKDTQVPFRSR